jgi:hypothetical protein
LQAERPTDDDSLPAHREKRGAQQSTQQGIYNRNQYVVVALSLKHWSQKSHTFLTLLLLIYIKKWQKV